MMDIARVWPYLPKTPVIVRTVDAGEDSDGMYDETIVDSDPIEAYISRAREKNFTAQKEALTEIVTRYVIFQGVVSIKIDDRVLFDSQEWDVLDTFTQDEIGNFTRAKVNRR